MISIFIWLNAETKTQKKTENQVKGKYLNIQNESQQKIKIKSKVKPRRAKTRA